MIRWRLWFAEVPRGDAASAMPLPAARVLLLTVIGRTGAIARYKRKSAV